MKRFFTFTIPFLTAALFTSCTVGNKDSGTTTNGLNEPFSANVSIKLDEMSSDGTLSRYGDGMWEITFNSPNTISGVTLSFADGTATASYKGLSFSVPQSALPIKSMMSNLISVTDELARKDELSGEKTDESIEINGNIDGTDYTLTVDKNGNLSSFEIPAHKLVMEFTDIVPIDSEIIVTTVTGTTESEITETTVVSE